MLNVQKIISDWKLLAQSKNNTAESYINYAIIRGFIEEKPPEKVAEYLMKAFSPVKNKNKLANGRYPYDTLKGLLMYYHQNPYSALMSDMDKNKLIMYREQIRRSLP